MAAPALTPDDVAGIPAGDIDQETYEALAEVWPAAYTVITDLLLRIQRGEQHEATSDWDMSLAYLVWEQAR